MVLNNEHIKILGNLAKLIKVQLSDERLNDNKVRKTILDGLSSSIIADILGLSVHEDFERISNILCNKNLDNDDKLVGLFAQGFSTALMMGFFQSLNSDRAVDNIPEFGYNGLEEVFSPVIITSLGEVISEENSNSLISTGLIVKLRDCSSEDYFRNNLYHDDILLLNSILTSVVDDGYNVKVLEAIRKNDSIATAIDTYKDDLDSIYTLMFEDSFGIHPYAGVLVKDGFLTLTSLDGTIENSAFTITGGQAILKDLSKRMMKLLSTGNVKISNSRQFNYSEIYEYDGTVYFPYKILEYMSGRESTLNINNNHYLPSSYSIDWNIYKKNYVLPNLEEILVRGIYHAIEKVCLDSKRINSNFISREWYSGIKSYDEFISSITINSNTYSLVKGYIAKLLSSMKCFYVLSRYTYLANKVANIFLRVSNSTRFNCFMDNVGFTEKLFKNLIVENYNEVFDKPFNLTEGRFTSKNIALSTSIYEYQYDINPMLSQAEPLFGYVIQLANQKKGRKSNWNNILIGESASGKELYASPTSDIKLQNTFIHNIYAGSRSGKGVMTMNILANAIANNKPIFYIDRKPEMGSMLYGLSKGKQFVVNGGLINPEFDITHSFDEFNGDAMAYWRSGKTYLEEHPEILELFGLSVPKYEGVLGDYVYFRAVMFCFGIFVLRTKMRSVMDSTRDSVFNGDSGIVLVIDELTGFQQTISNLFSNFSSSFIQKAINIGDVDTLIQNRNKLLGEIEVLDLKIEETYDANKPNMASKVRELELKREALEAKLNTLVDTASLYASTFYLKLRDNLNVMIDSKQAGFRGKEFLYSDIFVLGQELNANYYATSLTGKHKGAISSVFFPVVSTKDAFYADYQNADIVRSFLEELGDEDWFLGRNPLFNYANKSSDDRVLTYLDELGNWSYVGSHTTNEIRGIDGSTFNHTLFKPYLVLNNHFEENPANTVYDSKGNPKSSSPEFQFVTQCRDRVNKTAGGADLWSSVRLKHLTESAKAAYTPEDPQYNCLYEGVGFKGLVLDTMATYKPDIKQNTASIDGIIADTLARSGEIADYVAKKMGYSCWQELIYDFSPNGLFSINDMINAVMNPSGYTLESRLPLHAKLGLLNETSSDGMTPMNYEAVNYDVEPSSDYSEDIESFNQEVASSPTADVPNDEGFYSVGNSWGTLNDSVVIDSKLGYADEVEELENNDSYSDEDFDDEEYLFDEDDSYEEPTGEYNGEDWDGDAIVENFTSSTLSNEDIKLLAMDIIDDAINKTGYKVSEKIYNALLIKAMQLLREEGF